jgi:hypothetical protein
MTLVVQGKTAWFKAGVYELRGMSKGFQKGRCPLCSEEEDAMHIRILKCPDKRKMRGKPLSRKWLQEYNKFYKYLTLELRNTDVRCKWEKRIKILH